MVAMATASAEMSAHGHLHFDPTLEVPVKARCNTCCPVGTIFRKLFCCFSSNCCNTTEIHQNRVVYCKNDGTCVPFDPLKSKNHEEDYKKTADRVKTLVEQSTLKRGSFIRSETGVDLDQKSARGEPINLRELRKIHSIC